jgi:hypothetical protein
MKLNVYLIFFVQTTIKLSVTKKRKLIINKWQLHKTSNSILAYELDKLKICQSNMLEIVIHQIGMCVFIHMNYVLQFVVRKGKVYCTLKGEGGVYCTSETRPSFGREYPLDVK